MKKLIKYISTFSLSFGERSRLNSTTVLLLAMVVFISGCGGGVVGTTGYQREFSPAESALTVAWQEFSLGHYSNAIEEFNNVLTFTHTDAQAVDANIGLGYSHTRTTGIDAGGPFFEAALKLDDGDRDAKVGLCGYYLSTAVKSNMAKGVTLLTSFGLDSVDYVYTPKRDYGVNNAMAHALMAALYNYVGEVEKAKAHARKAAELNVAPTEPPWNTVTQVVTWINSRQ
jgi:tetratricopeptide (TPR) repeat protein